MLEEKDLRRGWEVAGGQVAEGEDARELRKEGMEVGKEAFSNVGEPNEEEKEKEGEAEAYRGFLG